MTSFWQRLRKTLHLERSTYMAKFTPTKLLLISAVRAMGGQAVINGVMMRGDEKYAVAVRRMDDSIDVKTFDVPTFAKKFVKVPFVRGVMGLGEAMALGYRSLMHSANLNMLDEENKINEEAKLDPSVSEQDKAKIQKDLDEKKSLMDKPLGKAVVVGSVIFSIVFFVSMFKVGPLFLSKWIADIFNFSKTPTVIIESVLRLALFIGYLFLVSLAGDIKRVFQYHGAEHKAIAAYENDVVLTPQAAQQFKTAHVRCGTNFLLIVMVLSGVFYIALSFIFSDMTLYQEVLSRVLGIFAIASISYEIIRLASFKMASPFTRALVWPGLQLQKVTTRPPNDGQCEVAIASLIAVFSPEQLEEVASRSRIAANDSWQILTPIPA